MDTSIFPTLIELGVVSEANLDVFSVGTRDNPNVTVWRDRVSGIIFIKDSYVGDSIYEKGAYRAEQSRSSYESIRDAERRLGSALQYVAGKEVLDFGCGRGEFLKLACVHARKAVGIELQKDFVDVLNQDGINCHSSLDAIPDFSLDTVVCFHVLEHLPDPLRVLSQIRSKLKPDGNLVIEVPHARDLLLECLDCEPFKQFTLWSQHLVLHTRESLTRMVLSAGYKDILIKGIQRYPLSNTLHWLSQESPGGHKSILSLLDNDRLGSAYQEALQSIDCTDSLWLTAKVDA